MYAYGHDAHDAHPPVDVEDQPVVVMTTRYPLDYPGGVERVAKALVNCFGKDDHGWRVVHIHAFEGQSVVARVPLVGDIVAAMRLARRTPRNAEVVVVHGAEYAWPVLLARCRSRRLVVVVWHGVRGLETLPPARHIVDRIGLGLFRLISDVLQRAALSADATIAVSPSVSTEIRDHFGFTGAVQVVPNGIAQRASATRSIPTEELAAAEARVLRVIWVGTSPYKKGLDLAVAGCERARSLGLPVSLTVVGVQVATVATFAPGPPGWVSVRGPLAPSDVDALLPLHDVLLFPSRYEACSMIVLEALAAGLPVVGSAVLQWQILGAGVVVEESTPMAYADALLRMSDSVTRRRLSVAARQRAGAFSWAIAADGYISVLDSVVKSSGGTKHRGGRAARSEGEAI